MSTATASGRRLGNLAVQLSSRDHQLVSGVPSEDGGNNEGMTPHELVTSALAACTIMTAQMYANRKQWPLQSVEAVVTIASEGPEGAVFKRHLRFIGDLNDEQRARLLQIADKCPIHKLLSGKIEIQTQLL